MAAIKLESCTFALFGALGDLALRKLFPALYQLDRAGLLHDGTRILALAREAGTPDSHLGRVSSVEHVIGVAGPDIGNARAGLVAGLTTPAWSALVGALTCLGAAAWVALTHRQVAAFRVDD